MTYFFSPLACSIYTLFVRTLYFATGLLHTLALLIADLTAAVTLLSMALSSGETFDPLESATFIE